MGTDTWVWTTDSVERRASKVIPNPWAKRQKTRGYFMNTTKPPNGRNVQLPFTCPHEHNEWIELWGAFVNDDGVKKPKFRCAECLRLRQQFECFDPDVWSIVQDLHRYA